MPLTAPQLVTLKAAVLADPQFAAAIAVQDWPAISDVLNATFSPTFTVWRSSVPRAEILRDAGYDWTRVDNLSVGKARIWDSMFADGPINPSFANVRTGVDTVWVGTQADLNVKAVVYVHLKRAAKYGEKVFASGTGTDPSPATMAVEGNIAATDVQKAMALP